MVVGIKSPIPSCGLNNLGNTCFFNATMQCLLSLEEFTSFIETCSFSEKQPLSKALQNFIYLYRSKPQGAVNPNTFINGIASKIKLFDGRQQDAHSFLELLLSGIFEENKPPGKNMANPLEDLFLVEHKDTITCKKCFGKIEVRTKSPIQWLFINESITQSILAYESIEDYVDDESQWHCDKCKRTVSTGIKHKITSTSQYIILHLNRFQDLYRKNNKEIKIDEYICINGMEYKITGTVCHSGSLNFGHYYAYAKRNSLGGKISYYKFNDSSVSGGSPSVSSNSPYIVFYERISRKDGY